VSAKSLTLLLRSQVPAAVLLQYLGGRTAKAWRRVFPDRERAEQVAEVRRAFERDMAQGQFSNTWFDGSIELWVELLSPLQASGRSLDLLEVGSWEGRSSAFLLSYLTTARLTAVDSWAGGIEHQQRPELATLEQRFDHNVSAFRDRLVKRKGLSSIVLAELAAQQKECFDFIFIDGSHFADDVMIDAVLAWQLLREGGVMVFDDYLWRLERYGWKKNPAPAVNLFLRLIRGDFALLHVGHQLAVKKSASQMRYLT
jgi:predicted O-methyltransferase YrrM